MNTSHVLTPASLTDATFEIQRSNHTYVLSVSFFESGRKISEIAFRAIPIERLTDRQANAFAHYAYLIETSSFLYSCDMQPINGIKKEKRILKDLIRKSNIEDFNNQLTYVDENVNYKNLSERVNLFVLDIKDKNEFYENTQEIEKAEEEMALFLQGAEPSALSPRKTFHHIIQNQQIRFFLREGKLKSDLIHSVSSEYADFFQKNSQGRKSLCQLCEIIMNFFKRGFVMEATDCSFSLHPSKYFSSTYALDNREIPEFTLAKIHVLNLLTLYPSYYRDVYSKEERYFQSLSNAFQAGYVYDRATGTTAITISNRE